MSDSNTLTQDELDQVIHLHQLWLNGVNGGRKADLTDMTAVGLSFRGKDLTSAIFNRTDISYSDFTGSTLDHVEMLYAVALEAVFKGSTMKDIRAQGTRFTSSDMHGVISTDGDFKSCKLDNVFMVAGRFNGCDFYCADLIGSNISGSWFLFANFTGSDLLSTTIDGCRLSAATGDGLRINSLQVAGHAIVYTADRIIINNDEFAITDEADIIDYAATKLNDNGADLIRTIMALIKAAPARTIAKAA